MKCLSPDIHLEDSSVVVKGGSSGLLVLACLAGSAALIALLLANRKTCLRTITKRIGKLENLRTRGLISDEECQARRMQILQEI